MQISIISASHRANSESKRISSLPHNNLLNIKSKIKLKFESRYKFFNNKIGLI